MKKVDEMKKNVPLEKKFIKMINDFKDELQSEKRLREKETPLNNKPKTNIGNS